MPELPDVEVFRHRLDATSLSKVIRKVTVTCGRLLDGVSERALRARLRGQRLIRSRREGKYLLAAVSGGGWLVLHFGMSGDLLAIHGHDVSYRCFRLEFANGAGLVYRSRRKLGHISWAEDADEFIRCHQLGPDALALTEMQFRKLLEGRRGQIKSALMDQSLMAGIGNIYSDEILFQAGVQPKRDVKDLNGRAVKKLFHTMRSVLKSAIRHEANPERLPNSFLLPHRERGASCPRCGVRLKTAKTAGRTSYFCPQDQK